MGNCALCCAAPPRRRAARLQTVLRAAVRRLAVLRPPCEARRDLARGDVAQFIRQRELQRALDRAEQVIEMESVLEAFDIVEALCILVADKAEHLDSNPEDCSPEMRAAAEGLVFASAHRGDVPELLEARTIFSDALGRDFVATAKEARGAVGARLQLARLLSKQKPSPDGKMKVATAIAAELSIRIDFGDPPPAMNARSTVEETPNRRRRVASPSPPRSTAAQETAPADRHRHQATPPQQNAPAATVQQRGVRYSPERGQLPPPPPQQNPSPAERQRPQQSALAAPGQPRITRTPAPPGADERVLRAAEMYGDAETAALAALEQSRRAAEAARLAWELAEREGGGGGGARGDARIAPEIIPPPRRTPQFGASSSSEAIQVAELPPPPYRRRAVSAFDGAPAAPGDKPMSVRTRRGA